MIKTFESERKYLMNKRIINISWSGGKIKATKFWRVTIHMHMHMHNECGNVNLTILFMYRENKCVWSQGWTMGQKNYVLLKVIWLFSHDDLEKVHVSMAHEEWSLGVAVWMPLTSRLGVLDCFTVSLLPVPLLLKPWGFILCQRHRSAPMRKSFGANRDKSTICQII